MVGNALSGDRDEFRRVFEAHGDSVFRYLYRLAGNRHDAEDLLQETFSRLWRKRDQFRGDGSLAGYVRRIAYRTFLNARTRLDRVRANQPIDHVEPEDGASGPADTACRDDLKAFLLAEVRRAVDDLPESSREPFVLFRYEGLSLKEIAETMDITPKAVELRIARALKRVAECVRDLKAQYGESLPLG